MSAMPRPAVPAPWMTTRWSRIREPAARTAENTAASTTAAVPCMSSLNVQHLVGVLVQDAAGVGGAEVLPVQHRVREQLADRGDVGVDQVVVALVADPGVPGAQVHVVVEQLQVVGAHVQHHREHPARVDARRPRCRRRACRWRSRCRRRPGRRCPGCPRSRWPPAGRRPRGPRPVLRSAVSTSSGWSTDRYTAARAAELVAEPFDRQPDRRGVDDRQHLVRCAR